LLFWLAGSKRIPKALQTKLVSVENAVFVSVVSTFEIAVKASIGRLSLPASPANLLPPFFQQAGLEMLPLTLEHSLQVYDLPWHHRDPFDRLLIAQAMLEEMTLVTSDPELVNYDVDVTFLK